MTAEAIAGALDLDDNGMVKQAVQQRGGDDGAAKDIAPFGKAAVRGQNHRTALVAGIYQLKEQVTTSGDDRQIADLIDDQQLGPAQKAQAFAQGALPLRLGERTDDVGQGGEVDLTAGFDRLDTKGQRQVGFAAAGLTEKMDRLVAIDEVELGKCHDAVAVE